MRCIVHIDMDCFYAQVEAVRLGVDCRTEPYVLSQWGNLIAVNYPARKFGIGRFDTVTDALEKCPHVKISHVATYAAGEVEYRYHENPSKQTHKVALEPYREASRKIFRILDSFDGVEVEKGSVDEAFLDVTKAAHMKQGEMGLLSSQGELRLEDVADPTTIVIPSRQAEIAAWLKEHGREFSDVFDVTLHPQPTAENMSLLAAASRVVWTIRQKIYDELRYDCSAGIAHNKLLAKSISARHKPNQQTLLFPDCVASVMWDLPFKSIRGFGGKFGEVVRLACGGKETCREAWLHSLCAMSKFFESVGDAEYAYRRLRGYDEGKIRERSISKSLMASKAFSPPSSTANGVQKWVTVLSGELSARYEDFCNTYGVKGHSFNVKLGNRGLDQPSSVANKTFPLPELVTPQTLVSAAMQCVTAIMANRPGVVVNAVMLTIGSFKKQESDESGVRSQQTTLRDFFKLKNPGKRERNHTDEAMVITLSSCPSSPVSRESLKSTPGTRVVFDVEDDGDDEERESGEKDVHIID
ncbi:DNA polymerase eta, putative [Trypanosoma brucei gambiense DAL972]|uniref:DNA polymerase eta n=1 Tax=Trypanosoma brucei gambiense (strain MHOM/CI/86/DAL972) TaxID=679716 RepID=D0A1I0_TRYB9|nr:DNA polymerase eta, putative [Trypanosoma brucei gambiense DAL972]CBH15122.1 DNA polymerase eta, putative [Trypanosoma brucei gambiense DAL972]|eukprot:XP_011777388.1 DNA polymerase eta, putative [Trypanosoma brucei gambiense DAL972]